MHQSEAVDLIKRNGEFFNQKRFWVAVFQIFSRFSILITSSWELKWALVWSHIFRPLSVCPFHILDFFSRTSGYQIRIVEHSGRCSPEKHFRATPISNLYQRLSDWYLCKIKLFADDTSIYITVENALVSGDLLNNDLEIINTWSKKWLVSFNRSKTECMTIFLKKKKLFILHLSLITYI